MKTPPPSDEPSPADTALDALLAARRAERLDTSRAEFGFETRLLARLAAGRDETAGWGEFAVWCWRLLPGLAVVTVAFSLWTMRTGGPSSTDDSLFAAAAQPLPADDDDAAQWMAVELLAPI